MSEEGWEPMKSYTWMGPYASKNLFVYLIVKTSKDFSSVIGWHILKWNFPPWGEWALCFPVGFKCMVTLEEWGVLEIIAIEARWGPVILGSFCSEGVTGQ